MPLAARKQRHAIAFEHCKPAVYAVKARERPALRHLRDRHAPHSVIGAGPSHQFVGDAAAVFQFKAETSR